MRFFYSLFEFKYVQFLLKLSILTLVGCSAGIMDKNAELSSAEKKSLAQTKSQNSLEITEIELETATGRKESMTEQSNLKSKYFTLKVCVKDNKLTKELGVRTIQVAGVSKMTDSEGCVRWDHEIFINHTEKNKCRVFEKEIRLSSTSSRKLRYSIDYINDTISDLDKSKGCVLNAEELKLSSNVSPIIIENIKILPGKMLASRSDIKYVPHYFTIETCLHTGLSGKAIVNAKLEIEATNLETGQVSLAHHKDHPGKSNPDLKTGIKGCFAADFIYKFEQYLYNHSMEISLNIKIKTGPLKGASIKRSIYINPWEAKGRHRFGIGHRGRTPIEAKLKHKYAKFHLDGVMYIQIGNDTNNMTVNDYLGLTVFKKYQVVLNPYIDREIAYSGNRAIGRLFHPGKFKFTMMILAPKKSNMEIDKNNFENFEFITGVEKIVHVKNGIINETVNIPFKMTDLPRLAVRTMSIMKIEPIDDISLKSTIVSGFFKARIAWIKTNVFQEKGLELPTYVDDTWEHVSKIKKPMPTTHAGMDKVCSTIEKMEHEDCLEGLSSIQHYKVDGKVIKYRKFMKEQFEKLATQISAIRNPVPHKITPKEIFTNHLKNIYEDIQIETISSATEQLDLNLKTEDFDAMMPPNLTHSLMTPNMTEEFCKYGFNSKKEGDIKWHRENRTMLKRCIKRPGDFFRVKPIRHVNKVKSIGQSHSNSYVLNTAGAYGVVKSEEDNHAVTTAWFIAGDFGGKTSSIPMLGKVPLVGEKLMKMGGKMANFLPGLGFKAGHSYNVSDSHSKRRGFNFSEKITSGQTLGIEQFVLDLNLEVERCVVVSSKRFFNTRLAAERADYISANLIAIDQHSEAEYNYFYPQSDFDLELYICDTKPKAEMFTESWFFIKNNAGIPFAVDGDSPTERRLLKVIRGSQSYRELHRAIKKNSTMALETDNIAFNTPTDILIKTWGHLLDKRFSDEEAAKFLIQNVEGSFPGTIEGSGGQRFDESGIQSF